MKKIECIKDKYGSLIPVDKISYISQSHWVSIHGERKDIDHNTLELLRCIFKEIKIGDCIQEKTADKVVRHNSMDELKESEDERIRKDIVFYIAANHKDDGEKARWLYWLEKQGEQNPTDKAEPKFKVGDWVVSDDKDVHDDYRVCKITKIVDGRYYIEGGDFLSESSLALYEYRPWTIQDAKDGDVLNSMRVQATIIFKGFADDGKNILAYCALQKGIFIKQEMLWDRDFEPCPKNWNNELFSKMKEAGYEWDAEKKELKKIEQNPAWSEEDKEMFDGIIADVEVLKEQDRTKCGKAAYQKEIDWLKNLKDRVQPQNTWKPSEEMLEALGRAIPENVMEISEDEMLLSKLYQGLKYGRVLSKK